MSDKNIVSFFKHYQLYSTKNYFFLLIVNTYSLFGTMELYIACYDSMFPCLAHIWKCTDHIKSPILSI